MAYIHTPEFDRWAKSKQRRMLSGIYSQVRSQIIDWNTDVVLPIAAGTDRWRQFTVTLRAFRVMASYELPFADEDPQFVGVSVVNNNPQAFAAPTGDLDTAVGDTKPVGLEVMRVTDLDINAATAELVVRAYDQTEPIARTILSEFASTARASLNGVIAGIPYGGPAGRIGEGMIDKIHRLASAPKQIGDTYTMFVVAAPQVWKRQPEVHAWTRYKFVAFVEEDPSDADTPYKEIYLTLWELQLLSKDALTVGTNAGKTPEAAVKVAEPVEVEVVEDRREKKADKDDAAEGVGQPIDEH